MKSDVAPVDLVKNQTETLRIQPTVYEGHELVDIRVHFENDQGELARTRKGVTFKRTLLPKVIPALQAILDAEDPYPQGGDDEE